MIHGLPVNVNELIGDPILVKQIFLDRLIEPIHSHKMGQNAAHARAQSSTKSSHC